MAKLNLALLARLAAAKASPAAFVDLDAFDRNIAAVDQWLSGKQLTLRLATKSIRVPALIRRALERGRSFRGLMCYSAEEAVFLSEQGFDDLLIAYPVVDSTALASLVRLVGAGKRITLVVDSREGVDAIAGSVRETFSDGAIRFRVLIDVDASWRIFSEVLGSLLHIGVRRSPIRTDRDLRDLIAYVQMHSELELAGAMAYEAHIAGLTDRNPFKKWLNPVFFYLRKLAAEALAQRRRKIRQVFEDCKVRVDVFNGGGTGSLSFAVQEPALTEVTAGSGLLCSHLFDYYSNVRFEPAAFFALQVTRKPDPNVVTCQSGGFIASGEPGWDRLPVPVFPEGLAYLGAEGAGEVQTPLRGSSARAMQIGAHVLFRHAKAGELAERFCTYALLSGGAIVDEAKTYRGYGKAFY